MTFTEDIARLNQLREQGAISEAEFAAAKSRLLDPVGGSLPTAGPREPRPAVAPAAPPPARATPAEPTSQLLGSGVVKVRAMRSGGVLLAAGSITVIIWVITGPFGPFDRNFFGKDIRDYILWGVAWLPVPLLQLLVAAAYLAATRVREVRGAGIALGLLTLPFAYTSFYNFGMEGWTVALTAAAIASFVGPFLWRRR